MNIKTIKQKLNKIFEDMGGMVSSAAGITGIESLPKKKKVIRRYREVIKEKINKKKSPV